MFSKSSYAYKRVIKVISFVLIQTFLLYNVGIAQPAKTISISQQKDTLAPYVVSRLVLDEKAIKRLDGALASSKEIGNTEKMSLKERIARVKRGWVRNYLKKYLRRWTGGCPWLDGGAVPCPVPLG